MTNNDHWQRMCKSLDSPQQYIDVGWLFTVAAALQRRVWTGSQQLPCFPNMYIWLMGPPGIGKGLVLTTVKRLLRHHKQLTAQDIVTPTGREKPPVISTSADNTTYEGLLFDMANSPRYHRTPPSAPGKYGQLIPSIPYVILLEELSSMVKEKNMDIGQVLLRLFEANDYDYKLKNGSSSILRNTCTSMLAGTTPAFLKQAARMRLFDDGLTARVLMVCGDRRRFDTFNISNFDEQQLESEAILLEWIGQLLKVYGNLVIPQKLWDFLEDWYRSTYPKEYAEADESMKAYYGRKRIHVTKLAIAFHFSESLEMEMGISSILSAIEFLSHLEKETESVMAKSSTNWKFCIGELIKEWLFETQKPAQMSEIVRKFSRTASSDVLIEIVKDQLIGGEMTLEMKGAQTFYKVTPLYTKKKDTKIQLAISRSADDDAERMLKALIDPN